MSAKTLTHTNTIDTCTCTHIHTHKDIPATPSGPPRPRSLCSRCNSKTAQKRQTSPGRGTWAAGGKGRDLSIEREGREGRSGRRRHASANSMRNSRSHHFAIPLSNGNMTSPQLPSPSTTYREDFQTHAVRSTRDPHARRQTQSQPGTPMTSYPWATVSFSGASTPVTPKSKPMTLPKSAKNSMMSPHASSPLDKGQSQLRGQRPTARTPDSNTVKRTTYSDSFNWFS